MRIMWNTNITANSEGLAAISGNYIHIWTGLHLLTSLSFVLHFSRSSPFMCVYWSLYYKLLFLKFLFWPIQIPTESEDPNKLCTITNVMGAPSDIVKHIKAIKLYNFKGCKLNEIGQISPIEDPSRV